MEKGKMYFYTATILDWIPILKDEKTSSIIMSSLEFLVNNDDIDLFGYVVMPNHIHLLWKPNTDNLQLRFMKFTGQKLKFHLMDHDPMLLERFKKEERDREYRIWQRDPMAIEVYSRKVAEQKLDYIHGNPVQGKWLLADSPIDYPLSSARYYELGEKNKLLTHYMDYLG